MSAAGFGLPTSGLAVEPARLAVAALVGVAVAVPASLVPAIRASRVRPLAAMREGAEDVSGPSRVRTVAGSWDSSVGSCSCVLGAIGATFTLVGPGAVLTLVGLVLLGPAVARPGSALLGAPATALRGATGSLARRNAMRNPRTTAGAATALMVGVAVVTVFTVLGASIKASIGDVVRSDLPRRPRDRQQRAERLGHRPHAGRRLGSCTRCATRPLRRGASHGRRQRPDGHRGRPRPSSGVMRPPRGEGTLADVGTTGVAVPSKFADEHALAVGDDVP